MIFLSYPASIISLLFALPKVISSPIPASPLLPLPSTNLSSPLDAPTINLTASEKINYRVPDTVTSLEILTGAPLSSLAMRTTLTSCRSSIARSMYDYGGFMPIQPDPYIFPKTYSRNPRDIKFTGAEIKVYSTHAKEVGGLTWRQLDAVVRGLQDVMLVPGRYEEAQFKIYDGLTARAEQGGGCLYTARRKGGGEVDVA